MERASVGMTRHGTLLPTRVCVASVWTHVFRTFKENSKQKAEFFFPFFSRYQRPQATKWWRMNKTRQLWYRFVRIESAAHKTVLTSEMQQWSAVEPKAETKSHSLSTKPTRKKGEILITIKYLLCFTHSTRYAFAGTVWMLSANNNGDTHDTFSHINECILWKRRKKCIR